MTFFILYNLVLIEKSQSQILVLIEMTPQLSTSDFIKSRNIVVKKKDHYIFNISYGIHSLRRLVIGVITDAK